MQDIYFIVGKEVCGLAWCKVYSISQRKLNRMLKDISFGECTVVHGNMGKKRVNTKADSVAVWMERYFNLIGDTDRHISAILSRHESMWRGRTG